MDAKRLAEIVALMGTATRGKPREGFAQAEVGGRLVELELAAVKKHQKELLSHLRQWHGNCVPGIWVPPLEGLSLAVAAKVTKDMQLAAVLFAVGEHQGWWQIKHPFARERRAQDLFTRARVDLGNKIVLANVKLPLSS